MIIFDPHQPQGGWQGGGLTAHTLIVFSRHLCDAFFMVAQCDTIKKQDGFAQDTYVSSIAKTINNPREGIADAGTADDMYRRSKHPQVT